MENTQTKDQYTAEQEQQAMARVKSLKAFYRHGLRYVLVISGLLIINLLFSPAYLWVVFPALGWGVGVAFHGLNVFGQPKLALFDEQWEQAQVQKILSRMDAR